MSSVECRGCRAVSAVSAVSTVSIDWGVGPRGTCVLGPLVGKRGPSCPYISAQSPSPRMFLKNLRQRIVQYYIKIEPCHAKVFRPTMVQRHIRDRANADSAVCTPKHQTMLYMSAQSPSPWTFLTNLRQRIVQYYTKIEPGYAKVFRQTTVQRHIRDRANADSAVCTPKHQTMLYMSAQSPSPWTFLTNLRQRIVQYYTKIEPGYAKVFRQTTVQRHIRDCVTISAVPSGRAGSACDLLCWSGALC